MQQKAPQQCLPVLLRLRNSGKYICQESPGVLNAGLSSFLIKIVVLLMVGPAEETCSRILF